MCTELSLFLKKIIKKTDRKPYCEIFMSLLATCGGLGYAPIMPGTIASAVTAVILFFMSPLSWMSYFLIFSFLFIAGLVSSNCVVRIWGIRDPSCVVIDEVCGMYLALMFTPKIFVCYLCTFLIFRFFDILKVSIIKTVEKILSGGFGIMMDDFVAAGFTLILFQMIFRISLFFS